MNRKGFAPLFIILIVIVAVALGGGTLYYTKKTSAPKPLKPVACTQEAKQCPDGSYVGRTAPNCEFAACPEPAVTISTSTLLDQGEKILEGYYRFDESIGGLTRFYYNFIATSTARGCFYKAASGLTFRESSNEDQKLVSQLYSSGSGKDRLGAMGRATVVVKDIRLSTSSPDPTYSAILVRVIKSQPLTREQLLSDQDVCRTDASTWKTYRNEKHGFEFKYPVEWKSIGVSVGVELVSQEDAFTRGKLLKDGVAEVVVRKLTSGAEPITRSTEIRPRKTINISGEKATKIVSRTVFSTRVVYKETIIHIYHRTSLYEIYYAYREGDKLEPEFTRAFDQILSTFKFIPQQSTAAVDKTSCSSDSDCVLFMCSGPFNKEYAKTLPADLPCAYYYGYKVSCIDRKCTAVK